MAALDDQATDPEEQRKKIEARETAQNLGAVIGLVAGTAIALAEKQGQEKEQQQQLNQQQQM